MRKSPRSPDITLLKELFNYDPQIGVFTHKKRRHGAKPGGVAGTIDKDGYRLIKIAGKKYFAHLCAWFWVYGIWPEFELDHINGVGDANWIDNLRPATRSQNCANAKVRNFAASGLKGAGRMVYPSGRVRWRAQITKDGKVMYLGIFDTPEEAHQRCVEKAKEIFGEFAFDGKRAA